MLFRPVARPLIVVLLALGCGRRPVATQPPERPEPAPEATATPAAEDVAASPGPAAPQSVSFADDADPEPTTMVPSRATAGDDWMGSCAEKVQRTPSNSK